MRSTAARALPASASNWRRSTLSLRISDWRAARSMAVVRAASDCTAALRSSARAASVLLWAMSRSRITTARRAVPPSSAAINRKGNQQQLAEMNPCAAAGASGRLGLAPGKTSPRRECG
jgi:hypothetical protein